MSKRLPLPEYPRPQLRRKRWLNLNGQWQFSPASPGQAPPTGRTLPETILVPYPMQSALSGIKRHEERSWYRRTFRVPRAWGGRRVMLNFGAVTHEATVYVNGRRVGFHKGSYDAFSIDITRALRRGRSNELIVGVFDNILAGGHPLGKQFPASASVFFTASSGIWQTVWLEPVARAHITRLDVRPDLARRRVLIKTRAAAAKGATVVLRARAGRRLVGRAVGRPGQRLAIRLRKPRLWSPDRPFLYGLQVEVRRGRRVVDRARSYFGMRSVRIGKIGGIPRPLLNGRFVFQIGTLDQGYWPDGVYTAPTDAALRFDIAAHKRLGFNMVRKHIKVEPQRYYYWADKLGILVWQDMPSMPIYRPVDAANKREHEHELRQMIEEHRSSPAIVSWIPFNEGWGEYDVDRITDLTKRLDSTRLVNGHSGGANCCAGIEPKRGDIRDSHLYNGPWAPPPDRRRASVTGEFGGVLLRAPGHEYYPERATALAPLSRRSAEGLLRRHWDALEQEMRTPGLSGAVFTEIYDVEQELAGLLTYDRRRYKVSPALVRRLNRHLIAASRRRASLRPQGPSIPKGPTGVWDFDEGAGSAARDSSGRGRTLTLENGAGWEAGHRGSALRLRGGGQRARAAGPVVDTRSSFTVSAWLRADDVRRSGTAVSQEGSAVSGFSLGGVYGSERADSLPGYADNPGGLAGAKTNDFWLTFAVPPGPSCDFPYAFCRANTSYDEGRTEPKPGSWHHVVGVLDRPRNLFSVYIDGQPADTKVAEHAWSALGRFTVGGGQGIYPGDDSWVGAIDQVRTYDRALNAAAIWGLHRAEARG